MAKRTGPSNKNLVKLIEELKVLSRKENVKLWGRIAKELEKPTRKRRSANIFKIDKFTKEGEIAIVPGKVLSLGNLTKKLTVSAFQFSNIAREKINKVGNAISIKELMEKNPKGKKVRIIG